MPSEQALPAPAIAEPTQARTSKLLYRKHPLAIRWFHWVNFPVLFLMIWSGLLIYWANQVFTIPVPLEKITLPAAKGVKNPPTKLIYHWHRDTLFPDAFYSPAAPKWVPKKISTETQDDDGNPKQVMYSMDQRLAEGMGWHFTFAWIFGINGFLYVIFLIASREWKLLVPRFSALRESIHVVLFDLHLTRKPLPVRKYNAAQQIAYTGVIVMGAVMLLTGIAIYKPAEQGWLTSLFGGYSVARFIHFWTTMLFLGFFLVHVGQVVKTGWNNFRGMITGYELVTPDEKISLESDR